MPVSNKRKLISTDPSIKVGHIPRIEVRDSTPVEEAMDALLDAVLFSNDEVDVDEPPDPPDCVMGDVLDEIREWRTRMELWADGVKDSIQNRADDAKVAAEKLKWEIVLADVGATTIRRK